MKAIQHFERSLAREQRADTHAEPGSLSTKRARGLPAEGRGGKRFAGAYVEEEKHAALSALAALDRRPLSNYIAKLYAEEIERHADLLATRN